MKPTTIFQEFEKIAEALGIRILQEKGNFNGEYCLLEEKRIIVLNKLKPLEQRIRALSQAFASLDTLRIHLNLSKRDWTALGIHLNPSTRD